MIVEDGDSRVVQFSHFSVKEYLMSSRLAESSKDVSRYHIQLEPAHTVLAQACLGVLLRLDDGIDRNNIDGFPLARYAAQYWVEHAKFGNVAVRIEDGMDCLFDADKPHFASWLWIYNEDRPSRSISSTRPSKPQAVPLYYAALHGFHDLAERLLAKHPEYLNVQGDSLYPTPLYVSASRRHYDVFSLLIDHLPTADIPIGWGRTALHVAAWQGQLEIGKQLLGRGADVNARDGSGWTPLHIAADWGQFEFARMLLEHKAQIDPQTDDGDTPLHRASRYGHVKAMQLFLEYGASISVRNKAGRTPFELAPSQRHPEVGRLISEYGGGSQGVNCAGS
jgi:ankyrin repeat protein